MDGEMFYKNLLENIGLKIKNKIMKKALLAAASLLATLVLITLIYTSYILSPKYLILGDWTGAQGDKMTFYKDGTMTVQEKDFNGAGNYKFLDNSTVRLDLGGIGSIIGPQIAKFVIDREGMVMSSNGGIKKYYIFSDNRNIINNFVLELILGQK